jgi:hypothetical protein
MPPPADNPRRPPHARSGADSHRQNPFQDPQVEPELTNNWPQNSPTEPPWAIPRGLEELELYCGLADNPYLVQAAGSGPSL